MKVEKGALTATFHGNGRQPQCPADPTYPDGKPFDGTYGEGAGCVIELIHPTPECGLWLIHCAACGLNTLVTAAGRPDDPSVIVVPCLPAGVSQR